jgi:hypothetical protein
MYRVRVSLKVQYEYKLWSVHNTYVWQQLLIYNESLNVLRVAIEGVKQGIAPLLAKHENNTRVLASPTRIE